MTVVRSAQDQEKVRVMATTFRIWQFAESVAWDVTIAEIADKLDVSPVTVQNILRARGWTHRVRAAHRGNWASRWSGGHREAELAAIGVALRSTDTGATFAD